MVRGMYRRLRDMREDKDLPQRAVAEVLHVSQATYSRYESGALDIPSGILIALALFYETSIDYLVGLSNDPRPYRRTLAPAPTAGEAEGAPIPQRFPQQRQRK